MKKFLITLAVLVVLGGGLWLYLKNRPVEPPESVMPTKADIEATVSVNATLTPQIYAHISSEIPTRIQSVSVKVGDKVEANQEIVTLNRNDLYAQINTAKLAVERAELAEQDARSTSARKFNSEKQRLSLKKASEQARQQLNQVYAAYAKTNLTSPISGVVSAVNARVGEVGSGMLVRIIDPESVKLEAFISETDIVSMHVGQKAHIEFDALKDTFFDATIDHIDPEAISIQDVIYFRALFVLDKKSDEIRIGMTGDIDIVIDERQDALTVPLRFVRRDDTGEYVYVADALPGEYKKLYITTDMESDDGLVEVLSGIDATTPIYAIYDEE